MRKFLRALIPAAILCAATTANAEQVLKLGHVLSANSQFSVAARVMNEELQKQTAGKYRIQEYPASALGAGPAMLDGVKLGTIDMVISSSGGALEKFNPEVGILDLMFLFRDAAHADSVLDGPIGENLLASFRTQGVEGLAWAENGFRHLTNSKHPIRKPEDLKGFKIRLSESEIYKKAFQTLGADPISLPFAQVYPFLQSGQADGQENPVTTIAAAKLYEVQKHITLSNHTYAPAAILINKDLFDELGEQDRKALVEAARLGAKASREFVRKSDETGLSKLKEAGMVITTDFDRAAFEKALEPFYQEYAKRFTIEKIAAIKNYKPQ